MGQRHSKYRYSYPYPNFYNPYYEPNYYNAGYAGLANPGYASAMPMIASPRSAIMTPGIAPITPLASMMY